MNKEILIDSMNALGEDIIAEHLERKERLKAERAQIKRPSRRHLKLISVAAAVVILAMIAMTAAPAIINRPNQPVISDEVSNAPIITEQPTTNMPESSGASDHTSTEASTADIPVTSAVAVVTDSDNILWRKDNVDELEFARRNNIIIDAALSDIINNCQPEQMIAVSVSVENADISDIDRIYSAMIEKLDNMYVRYDLFGGSFAEKQLIFYVTAYVLESLNIRDIPNCENIRFALAQQRPTKTN